MTSPRFSAALCLALALAAAPSHAALDVGDPAPRLAPGKWVQGEAVKEMEGDKVYFLEFWATWCGPCIAAIPHVNELHLKYHERGLVVIGQNVWENRPDSVPAFVDKMGGKMTYRVAMDDTSDRSRGRMAVSWLGAAGIGGIPCAILVGKDGKIAFIGHPSEVNDQRIEELLKAPSTKAPAAGAKQAVEAGKETLETAAQAAAAIRANRLDEAEQLIGRLDAKTGGKHPEISGLLYLDLLLARKQDAEAAELGSMIARDLASSPAVPAAVAEKLAARADAPAALLAAAESIAKPLAAAEGPGRLSALGTLARVAMQRGDKDRAVELQEKALALDPDAAPAKAALEAYRQGRLP